MDEDFLGEYLQTNSLENFRGTVQKILINNPLTRDPMRGSAFLEGSDGGISVGDACPNENPVDNGLPGGGGGSDPGSGGSDYSYECTTYVVTTTWYSQACSTSGCAEPVVIGQEQSTVTECGWVNENNAAGTEDDCEPEEGEIPIVLPIETRCDADPLALMMITDYNSGKNANRWGCVRLGATTCSGKKAHRGIDLVAAAGTTVYAIADGTVFASGTEQNADGTLKGFGHWIMIKTTIDGQTYLNLYAHLNSLPTVSGTITEGTALGSSGDSGNAVGQPHLHVEFRKFTNGTSYNASEDIDPEIFLGATFDEHGNTNWDVTCD